MEHLISDAPFPSREEVESILAAYDLPDRSLEDEKRFESLEEAWSQRGSLSRWPSTFPDRLDKTFSKNILLSNSTWPYPNYILEEGEGSINALQGLWKAVKMVYHDNIQLDVITEQHRLKERDIMSGRLVEDEDDAPLPSSLQAGGGPLYLSGMDARLAFYYGHPKWKSSPLPTASMVMFLDESLSQSPCAIEEVRSCASWSSYMLMLGF